MSGLYIGLIVFAVICILASFFVSEKLSSSDIEEISKISEKEIKLILDKELDKSSDKIKDAIDDKLNDAYEEIDIKTDKETNEKISHISEYSDTVLESMNNSHEEIKFMYSMLSDKQDKLKELEKTVSNLQSSVMLLSKELDERIEYIENNKIVSNATINKVNNPDVNISGIELASIKTEIEEETSFEAVLEEQIQSSKDDISDKEVRSKTNQEILDLYKEGLNEVDIAKKLGKGIGEVKLVLGLFK